MGKPEEKRKLGRPRRGWENNIKMEFHEIVWRAVDWSDMAQQRDKRRDYANAAINVRVSQNADNFLTS